MPFIESKSFKQGVSNIPLNEKNTLSSRPCDPKYSNINQKWKFPLPIQLTVFILLRIRYLEKLSTIAAVHHYEDFYLKAG